MATRSGDTLFSMQVVLMTVALATTGASAIAQQTETSEVKIEAVRSVQRVGTSTTGAPIEIVQLTRKVSYADLDLATHRGALELERRINDTAKAACKQLDALYPVSTSEGPGTAGKSCVKDAVDGAMIQARASIAAAEKATAIHSAEAPAK
jgi:UrcA family protein